MAARYTALGAQVLEAPKQAHAQLRGLFISANYSAALVAEVLEVDVGTLRRWIKKLEAAGYSDPRGKKRAPRGRDKAPRQPRKKSKSLASPGA